MHRKVLLVFAVLTAGVAYVAAGEVSTTETSTTLESTTEETTPSSTTTTASPTTSDCEESSASTESSTSPSTTTEEPNCGFNEEYAECKNTCPKRCNEKTPQACTKICVRGCQCKDGFYLNRKNQCVLPIFCGFDLLWPRVLDNWFP